MSRPAPLSLSIDRTQKAPLFEQIAFGIRQKIMQGDVPADMHLPPTRSFALELGVSRSTVVTAYEQLVAEGYVQGQQGAGFRVCQLGGVQLPSSAAPQVLSVKHAPQPRPQLFQPGAPDMSLFPYRAWAKAVGRVCRQSPESMLIDTPRFGHLGLRATIAQHVAEWRGLTVDPAQVIVTAGAGDALELCLRVLCIAGDVVAIEDPGYRPLTRYVRGQGLRPSYLPLDEQGAVVPKSAQVAVLTPSQQFPMGGTMSPQRRLQFLQWAQNSGAWIIEDDYDSEFRYAGHPIPAMAGMDGLAHSIYVGSFSKIFSNNLRIGYVIAPHAMLDQFGAALSQFGRRASVMPQAPLAEFMQTGEFYRHLRRMRRTYAQRRAHLVEGLRRDFADVGSFTDSHSGMQIAFHLKPHLADNVIAEAANADGLMVEALSANCLGTAQHNGLLMGFCSTDEAAISEGLIRLRKLIDQH